MISQQLKFIWLIPLIGGLVALLSDLLFHFLSMRLAINCYNTALAILANALILNSILYIAGSDSPYILFYLILSAIFASLTVFFIFYYLFKKEKAGD